MRETLSLLLGGFKTGQSIVMPTLSFAIFGVLFGTHDSFGSSCLREANYIVDWVASFVVQHSAN